MFLSESCVLERKLSKRLALRSEEVSVKMHLDARPEFVPISFPGRQCTGGSDRAAPLSFCLPCEGYSCTVSLVPWETGEVGDLSCDLKEAQDCLGGQNGFAGLIQRVGLQAFRVQRRMPCKNNITCDCPFYLEQCHVSTYSV